MKSAKGATNFCLAHGVSHCAAKAIGIKRKREAHFAESQSDRGVKAGVDGSSGEHHALTATYLGSGRWRI